MFDLGTGVSPNQKPIMLKCRLIKTVFMETERAQNRTIHSRQSPVCIDALSHTAGYLSLPASGMRDCLLHCI